LTIQAWVDAVPDSYLGYEYPPAVQFLGWFFELLALAIVVVYGIIVLIENIRKGDEIAFLKPGPMMLPTPAWGPRPDSGLPTVAASTSVAQDNPSFQIDEP